MKTTRANGGRLIATAMLFVVALVLIAPRAASAATVADDPVASGRRIAEAWCKQCHAIDANALRTGTTAPDFTAVANQPSTTALSLKVFLRSDHAKMPNFIIEPNDTDDVIQYILSLKRN
jgi:mono/diheme cytochrome c family protein